MTGDAVALLLAIWTVPTEGVRTCVGQIAVDLGPGAIDVRPHHPHVVCSNPDRRAIVIDLPAGERLDEHQVHEASWLVVTSGRCRWETPPA